MCVCCSRVGARVSARKRASVCVRCVSVHRRALVRGIGHQCVSMCACARVCKVAVHTVNLEQLTLKEGCVCKCLSV